MGRPNLVRLTRAVARAHPRLDDPEQAIRAGRVVVDGLVQTNPATMVQASASVVLDAGDTLRGTRKLQPALDRFPVCVEGAIALDAGAAAGGFTIALLEAGASRVHAVDAGFGQLVGSLRQDARVIARERTNIADLDHALVPDPIDVLTIDLSYLALAAALPQLDSVRFAPAARLVALVKPMFELRLATAPNDDRSLSRALELARAGAESAGWSVEDWMHSPNPGSRGAAELFLFARRKPGRD